MAQIIFGKNAITEIVNAKRRRVLEVWVLGNKNQPNDLELTQFLQSNKINFKITDRQKLDQLADGARHHGIVAQVEDYPYANFESLIQSHPERGLFVVCDSINDPQNFGAICRSAYCFGVDAVLIGKDRSVEVTSAVVTASAGAVEHLPIAKVTNLNRALEELKENGFWCYASDINGVDSLTKIKPSEKSVIVLGSEREGIRPLVLKHCDFKFSIPMARSFDSLNVAQAASIIFYEFSKFRLPT